MVGRKAQIKILDADKPILEIEGHSNKDSQNSQGSQRYKLVE
jgi:hypothetical protein